MALKDKKRQEGEPMPEAQFHALLQYQPEAGENQDFHVLLRAYRGMTPEDFARFMVVYRDAGRDVDATDNQGRSLTDIIRQHRHAGPYLEALEQARGN
jgi:hypothetical protein